MHLLVNTTGWVHQTIVRKQQVSDSNPPMRSLGHCANSAKEVEQCRGSTGENGIEASILRCDG